MTHDQFILQNNGKWIDFDNAYGAQCVDLVRFYWQNVVGINQPKGVKGAKDFWANYPTDPNLNQNYDRIANTDEFIPKAGDIMIWKHGEFGHIAVVATNDNTLSHFYAFSQNDPLNSPCKVIKYTYSNVYGVFRRKGSSMDCIIPNNDDGSKLFTKLVHNSDVADQTVRYLSLGDNADKVDFTTIKNSLEAREGKLTSCKNELSTRESDLAKALSEVSNREEQVGRLKGELTEQEKLHKAEITALKQTLKDPEEILKPFKAQIEQLRSDLKNEAVAKGTALNELAEVKARLENAEKGQYGDLTLSRWLSLLATVKW